MAKFQIQNASTTVNWTGKKVLGLHTGTVDVESGFLEVADGLIKGGEINIDMTSIVVTDIEDSKTHDEFLGHLQNDDFFSVERFKTARLEVTGSTPADNNNLTVSGHLTIKDITHPISFNAKTEVFTDFLHSMGEMIIDRALYNIRYGSGKFFANLGNKLIYDEFVLQFKLIGRTN
jgi:polyisoprenoid-binding protein YceI